MPFDAKEAKLLAPGTHLIIDDCLGLRLRASTIGRTWIYRYKNPLDGKMKQVKLGQWPSMSLSKAIGECEAKKEIRNNGRDPGGEIRASKHLAQAEITREIQRKKSSAYTVRLICDDYLTGHVDRHRKAKGAKELRRMFDTMLGNFSELIAADVNRAEAFDFLESYLHVPVQCSKLRLELGAAWDYALDAGRLPENSTNWWRLIMRGRVKSKGKKINGLNVGTVKRSLSETEVKTIVPWLPNFSRNVGDSLTLYLWTGTRGGEIMGMKGHEISEEADGWWWTIPKNKSKNARHENATDQRVALIGRALAIVRRRLELYGKGYLFPSTGKLGYVEQKTVQVSVWYHMPYSQTRPEQVRPRLPVTHWAPHDLRRTARTILASIDCPDSVAEAILGHMQPGIKGVYNRHSYDKERRVWLARLDQHLENIIK
jgi:integrase